MRRAVLALVVLAAACAQQHPATGLPGAALLRHVPADTPYVFAMLEPTPRAELERQLARQREGLVGARVALRDGPAAALPVSRVMAVLLDELEPNLTPEGLDRLGFGAGATAVIYGLGLAPAFRARVKDAGAVAALVGRIMVKSGGPAAQVDRHGHRWELPLGKKTTVVIAVSDQELLALVTPNGERAHLLGLLFGDEALGPTLADTTRLDEVARRHHLSPRLVGWLDLGAALGQALDGRSLAAAELAALDVGKAPAALPPACKAELTALVGHAARVVLGAEELTASRQRILALVELDGELVRELGSLRVSAVGVGAPLGTGVLSFGAAVDVPRLLDVLRARVRRVLAQPYTCDGLLGLNEAARELDRALGEPIPPWLTDLRALAVEVLEVQMRPLDPRVRGAAVLSAADPIRVMDLARRSLPLLPDTVPPDGRPVRLPGGIFLMETYVAMKGQLLGGAVGEGGDLELGRLMSERPLAEQPLLAFAFDGAKLQALLGEIARLSGAKEATLPGGTRGQVVLRVTVEADGLAFRFAHEEGR